MDQPPTERTCVCPTCRRVFAVAKGGEPAWFPFCCRRCQWIDLGKWLTGQYRVSEDLAAGDTEEE